MRLISSDAIAGTLPYPIKSGYIGLLTVRPEQIGGFQPIELPDLSEGPHFWYALQWFMFTAVGVAGIVVFIRGDLRARREERQDATEAHATV
jgi:cytochrome oxidase assembly protein ShyY1